MSVNIYTIGHSNHEYERLLELLNRHGVNVVWDVRSQPYSRYSSQFNRETLRARLTADGIRYDYWGDNLGGRPNDENLVQENTGQVDYLKVAQTLSFSSALDELLSDTAGQDGALLCSEKDPANCHRSLLIGRDLKERGVQVNHILADGELQSQAELEQRLMREIKGSARPDMFGADENHVNRAYRLHSAKVAYKA